MCSTYFPCLTLQEEEPTTEKQFTARRRHAASRVWVVQTSTVEEATRFTYLQWCSLVTAQNLFQMGILLESTDNPNLVESVFGDGDRAVHKAVRFNNVELLSQLINIWGASANAPHAITGFTPLMLAIELEFLEIVIFLLGRHPAIPLEGQSSSKIVQNTQGETVFDLVNKSRNRDLRLLFIMETNPCIGRKASVLCSAAAMFRQLSEQSSARRISMDAEEEVVLNDVEYILRQASAESHETEGSNSFILSPQEELGIPFRGWLMKRHVGKAFPMHRRFLVTQGCFIAWDSSENHSDIRVPENRNKFKNFVSFNQVLAVEAIRRRKNEIWFSMRIRRQQKTVLYEFKATTTEERDAWVAQLLHRMNVFRREF